MEFSTTPSLKSRKNADVLILPFWKSAKQVQAAFDSEPFKKLLDVPLSTQDFMAKEGEILFLYGSGQPEKRLALLGLGLEKELTVEKLRKAYSNVTKECQKKKLKEINLCPPKCPSMARADIVKGLTEGLLLSNYAFTALKFDSIKDNKPEMVEKVTYDILLFDDKA